MKLKCLSMGSIGQAVRPSRYLLLTAAVVALVLTAYGYDCFVLTNQHCVTVGGACQAGNSAGTITSSATMGMCEGGKPGNTECIGNTNSMVNCGYECSYTDDSGSHTKWQTNSIPKPTLQGEGC